MSGTTFLDGSQNLSALTIPDVYIDIIPPNPIVGAARTNYVGLVGVGSWGPVNSPVGFSTPDDCAGIFGYPAVRSYDIPSYVWAASQVGSGVWFYGVRVTDGTDAAASVVIQSTCLTVTAKYTGTRGNAINVAIQTGSKPNSYCLVVAFPGRAPERFDNITGSGNAFWVNAASAINNGNAYAVKSKYVVASAGAGTSTPTVASFTLSGGTDGVTSVTESVLLGADTTPRTGMYALRNTGVDAFTLCDAVSTANWAAQDSFALSENTLAVLGRSSGDTIALATAARVTAALDSAWSKIIVGDYPEFYDSYNGYKRLISPTAFYLGTVGNLSPQFSPLNKQIRGVVSTGATRNSTAYSGSELSTANTGGVDVLVGPPTTPGGNYFTWETGRNTSSNMAMAGDEWSRMTNFIARSLRTYAAGSIVGKLQSIRANDPTRTQAKMLLDGFFSMLKSSSMGSGGYGMIDDFAVTCDLTNNPADLQARGFLFAYAAVRYLNTVRYFVIKLAGGGNVDVSSQATAPTASQFS
jgi:hypothetical protein